MIGRFRLISKANEIFFHRGITSRNIKPLKFLPAPEAVSKTAGGGIPKASPAVELNQDTLELLQRLSLVGFEKQQVVDIVQEAITFAERIFEVDTTKVKPLVSLLEDETIYFREDVPDLDVTREELLSNSKVSQEHYFVTPIGNTEAKLITAQSEEVSPANGNEDCKYCQEILDKRIQFDFNINNLSEMIRKEWFLTNFVTCDQPVFQFGCLKGEADLKSAFDSVKNFVRDVPFSLIESYTNAEKELLPESSNAPELFSNYFKRQGETVLKSLTFCSPTAATETFLKQQRERKIWYRKFSASPGRFHLTATNTDNKEQSQFVEIQAEFPWGLETIEIVKYLPEFCAADGNFFQIKNQRKKIVPQVITCESRLENVTLLFLCDSYEGINEEELDRNMLRFSRKLAPYKVAFASVGKSAATVQNLKDLALLLSKKLRKCGLPVLLLPDVNSDLEGQMLRNDGLGIPYTIILNQQTLKDGILEMRSRDTTLKEQSHVSLIVSYVEKLIKNY